MFLTSTNSLPGNWKLVGPIAIAVIALFFLAFGGLKQPDEERHSKPVFIDQLDPSFVEKKVAKGPVSKMKLHSTNLVKKGI